MRGVQRLKRISAALGLGAAFACGTFGTSEVWSADATPEIRAISERLCRDGGGEWASVFELFVDNATERDWSERAVEIPIAGTPEKPVDGAAPLVGERAESVRFCDSDGVEFVFNIINKDGETVERGEIGEGFSLTIPATVPAGTTARYLVFSGNDRATAHPDQYSQIRRRLSNLDFEAGTGDVPSGWRFDVDGADRSMRWVDENPFSGQKCVRCDVADGAEPSWIAARQGGVAVEPGRKYRFTGRVRGENVRGTVGWYLHLGNEENSMISAPLLGFNDKTEFGWTELSQVYSVPADANRLEFGTVLRGTGTAWFDAVEVELIEEEGVDPPKNARPFRIGETFAIPATPTVYPSGDPNATRGAERFEPEKLGIAVKKTLKSEKPADLVDSANSAFPQYSGARCVLVRVAAPSADGRRLIRLDLAPIETRWGRTLEPGDFAILDLRGQESPLEFFDGAVFFEANVVGGARNVFAVVEKAGKNGENAKTGAARRSNDGANLANQAFPGTTLQTANPADLAGNNENNGAAEKKGADKTVEAGETGKIDGVLTLPAFLAENNIVADGDFETVDAKTTLPPGDSDWSRDAEEPGVSYRVVEPGVAALGSKALEITVDETAELRWRGWRRRVAVEPNRSYLLGYVVATDSAAGSFDLHIHSRRSDWTLAEGGMAALGKAVGGKTDWTLKTGAIRTTNDCAFLDLHLTNQTRGTARYDSVFVVPVETAEPVAFLGGRTGVFDVPAVVKVFPDTTFAADAAPVDAENPAFCALALDEEETLQLAIRSAKDERLEVVVRAPELKTEDGRTVKLDAPEVFAVSNVIVDYPSSYYQETGLETKRKFPTATPQSDGWIGLWPDPLIPVAAKTVKTGKPTPKRSAAENLAARVEFERRRAELAAEIAAGLAEFERRRAASQNDSLAVDALARVGVAPVDAFATRAIWLRFRTTPETVPGVYVGELILRDVGGKSEKSAQTEKTGDSAKSAQEEATAAVDLDALTLAKSVKLAKSEASAENGTVRVVPYRVEVLPFEAPDAGVSAIYDARISADFYGEGKRADKLEKIGEKLLERKLSPDGPTVAPKFSYNKETGVATADWAEYDRVTGRFFDELGAKAGYFPYDFYLFGWGMPPKDIDGEKPYEGEYPYENVDRSILRPEYKKAYQAKLKLYWEHIKEKGWDDNLVLYISDEPFYSKPEIIVQMKALCDMIHEVDPKIPIYCSTWVFVPEWLGYLDVWGVGHYGLVGEADLAKIRAAGSRIWWTTDGQMCLDAPYNAVERLLPYTCVARGAELYEFWGATWHTCDPFESASHLYISQSDQPGVRYYVRYPNGDGYIFYPGDLLGRPGEILDSVRSEQARRGVEDAGWLVGLRDAIQTKTKPGTPERAEAQAVLDRALNYLPLQCGCGRFATRYMSDPAEFEAIRLDVGRKLAELTAKP